ncbi:U7 snRNA-associated Sm-like protein LSm10, partial [Stegodyphus mimosarum]
MAARERAISSKTLISTIEALEGKKAKIEFRDDTKVEGKVESVDAYMNVHMTDVLFIAASGEEKKMKSHLCQGKFIRFIHFPDDADDPIEMTRRRLEELARMPVGRGRGRGRGRGGRGRGGPPRGGGGRFSRGGGGGGSRPRSYSSHDS